ncbi:competence type IV pilus assembly protein ComGB [Alteribacter keqinensis]|uniref:Type II secretion system protein GspF domain-containing protein n=1 Tax=Alteribacter keqinensis TaxID=2483800 RepID=A0A3M7TTI8_9BACI|nr:competence type IV pilus assembly protein ComGB [Alteribacter keqinensis]RNA68946.1 hypothetical protein EBO34_03015 [Alteribacter keqinensis]
MLKRKSGPFKNDLERGEWLKELAVLTKEGYPIKEGLIILERYYDSRTSEMIRAVSEALRQGEYFSDFLTEYGFSKEITNHLLMMEKYGNFHKGLMISADLCAAKYQLTQNAKKILQYPLTMLFALIVLVSVVLRSILPQFELFFLQMDQELPMITKFLFTLLQFFDLPLLITGCAILLTVLWLLKSWPPHRKIRILLCLPFIRTYTRSFLTYFLVTQLSPMLNSGLSLNQSLVMLSKDSQLLFYREEAKRIKHDIQKGELMSRVINTHFHYEEQLETVIALGEAKGRIGEELERYGSFLFTRITLKLEGAIRKVQPVLYIVIGLFVLVLFLSLMLPVFQMTTTW